MRTHDLLILTQGDVHRILAGQEGRIIELVRRAYEYHRDGQTVVPPSAFLRLSDTSRAIALPAYVAGATNALGMKWVPSFPGNPGAGLPRAIGTIILNDAHNGLPLAVIDGTLISAKRTAGSAALAASLLAPPSTSCVGLIGAGPINGEVVRFLKSVFRGLEDVFVYDIIVERSEAMCARLAAAGDRVAALSSIDEVFRRCPLVSFATSAVRPHVSELPDERWTGTILHISLRDLSPGLIQSAYNLVDDIDHICQHNTSVHLAETSSGSRDFIHATLGDLLAVGATSTQSAPRLKVFSPFGLGALDVVLADHVYRSAVSHGMGTPVRGMYEFE